MTFQRIAVSALFTCTSLIMLGGIVGCDGGDAGTLGCAPTDLTCDTQPVSNEAPDVDGGATKSTQSSGNGNGSGNGTGNGSGNGNGTGNAVDSGAKSTADAGQDAGHSDSGTATDAGTGADGGVGTACTANTDCASNLCLDFPAKGKHCTKLCSKATDCPAPSTGCFLVCLPP